MTAITAVEGVLLRVPADGPNTPAETGEATVLEVGPTGAGTVDPLVTATDRGRTTLHAHCSADELASITETAAGGDLPTGSADAVLDHDSDTTEFPAADLPGLDGRQVLGGCGWRRPAHPEDHEAAGGFADVAAADVRALAAGLRGRGWGDWSQDDTLERTWERAREAAGTPAVVVNAHGNVADALLCASAPFEVLEGAQAAARAVEADGIVVYASEDDEAALEGVRAAIERYPDPGVGMDVVAGPPAYRAAEPTMAIEAIEGNHRLEARLRPPGPEEVGLYERPTLVHTARTAAHLAVGLREGDPAGTRLVTVTGDVDAETTVELAESETLAAAVEGLAEGYKAACVGGRFGGLTASLDIACDPGSLAAAGLGTEGVVEVLGTDRCVLEFVGRRAQFAADTNCGRCVPCREGTAQLADLLRDVYEGAYDREKIRELQRVMHTTSICEFGVNAGRPARTAIEEFESEIEAHAEGHCPAGVCTEEVVA